MPYIRVLSTLDDLERDMRQLPGKFVRGGTAAVQRNTREGNAVARGIARSAAGPHGKNYFKRLSAEMIAPLVGEYGPEGNVVENAVGAGWRNGPVNTDLEKSLDIQGPKYRKSIDDMIDGLFW